jgi:hypothetical protein
MKESDFVEVVLSVADQQARSKQWYGDASYSEHEVLEQAQIIKRNGREFSIIDVSTYDGFEFVRGDVYPDLVLKLDGKEHDDANLLDQDDECYLFEGDDKDFIYRVSKAEFSLNPVKSRVSAESTVIDFLYPLGREMTDYEMDVLL